MTAGDAFQVWLFIGPLAVGAMLAAVGLWLNRRVGVNPVKDDLIRALQGRVTELDAELTACKAGSAERQERIDHLEQILRDQAALAGRPGGHP